jgi:Domain of unknown function (DUF4382)
MARLCKEVNPAVYFVCRNLLTAFCLFALPALAAERDQGVLEIRLKDHREAIDDFAKFNITVDKILIDRKTGLKFWQTGWKDLQASAETIDLTKFVGKKTARIFRGAIDAGSFDGLHIKIKNIDALLKKKRDAALVKNTIGPLKLSFQVPDKGATLLVLDLVVTDFSDHPPRGYELGIKGYELFTNGKSIQKVPPG